MAMDIEVRGEIMENECSEKGEIDRFTLLDI